MRCLGELETAVMEVLWAVGESAKVREVLDRLDTGRSLAYTTVLTVLDNLHRKGWVQREREGRAYRYRPVLTREEAAAQMLHHVLDVSGTPEVVLTHFVGTVSDEHAEVLRIALRERDG
ncbi:BlaI/MecI/CopY family transcriptional regulator [Saccharopolyspora rhizosphaerae]|uniref:BlaI/MecI/CopY family transcriptional regulator n=1 Tax=Saccharopolyspora rhizosphaerae TaxID=2492662 RepID=A0A426JY14_9PSEU|nr:BlaI/MecI/CopY family transcriptional regulator [Saccharopolyspora rhizosphaerae]RRO18013.1 BlaI/MecI/CopY family transcriptional regulator [Saccharopolyspora rhizosphaerae]